MEINNAGQVGYTADDLRQMGWQHVNSQKVEDQQKRIASALNERLHTEGAERFGMDWLKVHTVIAGAAQEDYVPESAVGNIDIRFVALLADAAFRLLSKYELKPRG